MSKKALIVIDVQNIFFAKDDFLPFRAVELVKNLNHLIETARQNDVAVIFVRHYDEVYMKHGSSGWQVYDGLDSRKTDFYVEKKTPDSFFETDLPELLEREKIDEIYLCGLQTDFCVDTTCRSAFSRNISAFLVEDAHSTYDTEILKAEQIINHHNRIIGQWFAKLIPTNELDFQG